MTEEEKEYRDILIKYYIENHSFIEKAVFTVTASAITFLLGYSDKISTPYTGWYSFGIGLFILTLIIQLYSAYISREGCDAGIGNPQSEKSENCFKLSEILTNTFMILFCIAIIVTSIVITGNARNTANDSNYSYEQTIITDDYNYAERRTFVKNPNASNGLNPPKATKPRFGQDGFNPPKNMPPKPVQPPKEKK